MIRLSPTAHELLSACAEIMMSQQQDTRDISLLPLNCEFLQAEDAIVVFLAEEVERRSHGRLTVRRADPALFAVHSRDDALSLAVCSAANAPELVTDLDRELTLYSLGPYSNGFSRIQMATPQAAAEHRAWVAECERENQWRTQGQQSAQAFLSALFTGVQEYATSTRDTKLRERLQQLLAGGRENFTLEKAAIASGMIGMDFREFIYNCL